MGRICTLFARGGRVSRTREDLVNILRCWYPKTSIILSVLKMMAWADCRDAGIYVHLLRYNCLFRGRGRGYSQWQFSYTAQITHTKHYHQMQSRIGGGLLYRLKREMKPLSFYTNHISSPLLWEHQELKMFPRSRTEMHQCCQLIWTISAFHSGDW